MRIINLLFCLLLSACASIPTVILPTPIHCSIPTIPDKVILPIGQLNQNSSQKEIAQAYTQSLRLLIIDDLDLRERLKAIQTK